MSEAVDLGAENDEQMARLREALALGDGFQLVIVQVEPGERREEVLRRLAGWSGKTGVPRLELVRLAQDESPVMRLAGGHAGVILVGLEADGPDRAERTRRMVTELNWSRDRLPERVHGPLVLVVSQRVQSALFEQAPDFYSWRTHSTSIAPASHRTWRAFPWLDGEPVEPDALRSMIAAGRSSRSLPELEIARLHERLGVALAVRGEFQDADAALATAYQGYLRAGTTDDRVELLMLRATVERGRGRLDHAAEWLDRARRDATRGTPSPRLAARLLSATALDSLDREDGASAETEIRLALRAAEAAGDDLELARLTYLRALLAFRSGDLKLAVAGLEEALDGHARAGDVLGQALLLMALARAAVELGRSDDAERHAADAVARAQASRSADMEARARACLAEIALANQRDGLAEEVLGKAVTPVDPLAVGHLAEARGQLALRRGELAAAERFLQGALDAYQRRGTSWRIANVALELGKLGRRTQNWALAATGFETARRVGDAVQGAVAALGTAQVAYDQGERTPPLADRFAKAAQLLDAARQPTHADLARQHGGAVLSALGRDVEARKELETALAGFEARGQVELAAHARELLAGIEPRGTEPTDARTSSTVGADERRIR
ncbi:MAG TPA: hypothetical protein VF516_36470 [Kofleriaceae bacterium]